MERLDQRIKRTQRALAHALIALTLERGYDAITIRDLADRAGVGYATFFRHYPDKDALLLDVLQVFLAELLDLLHMAVPTNDPLATSVLLFRYVEEHNDLCRVLLSSGNSPVIMQRVYAVGAASALDQYTPRPASLVPPAIAAHHLVAASIALIHWWLEHDRPLPVEHMAQIHAELIVRPTHALAFEP